MVRIMCSSPETHGKVLKVEKYSDKETHLVCASCGEIVGMWITDLSQRKTMSEENLKQWA